MTEPRNLMQLPTDLPIPEDDGACDHLTGMAVPTIALPSTAGGPVNLAETVSMRTVVYIYPRTGRPGRPGPPGWDDIPGARGCTPQSCAYRNHHAELVALGAEVYGLSTQTTDYQQEMAERLHLPFPVLSDSALTFAHALDLPLFQWDGKSNRESDLAAANDHLAKAEQGYQRALLAGRQVDRLLSCNIREQEMKGRIAVASATRVGVA